MPRYFKPKPLNELIATVIKERGFRQKVDEVEAIETWMNVAGPRVQGLTKRVWVEKNKLFVQITSSVWRNELHLQRGLWKKRLNDKLGRQVIREIIFR